MSTLFQTNKLNSYLKIFLFIYLFTVLSGALRKWFITSKEIANFIFLLQMLVPFSFLFIRGGLKYWRIGKQPLAILIVVLIFGIVNPLNLTINHGILGVLLHSSFFFVLFFYLNNRHFFEFETLVPFLVLSALAHFFLVFYQYTQPSDAFINTYADVESVGSIAIVGTSARVTGTFSYISGFTAFLFFHSLLVWTLFKIRYKSIYSLSLLLIGLVGCFMSGSRGATYLYLIVIISLVYSEYRLFRKTVFDFKLFFPVLLFATFLLGLGSNKFVGIIENAFIGFSDRRDRGIQSGEENLRILGDFYDLIDFKGNYPLLGVGLGSTYQGANRLFGTSPYVLEYGFFESELIRIILEGGFLLLFTRIIITIYLINQMYFPQSGKFILSVILLFFFPSVFNVYNSIFAALGIILLDHFYFRKFVHLNVL